MCLLASCSSVWEIGVVRSPSLCSGRGVFMVVAAVCSKPAVEGQMKWDVDFQCAVISRAASVQTAVGWR
jgi:hypothetical protein